VKPNTEGNDNTMTRVLIAADESSASLDAARTAHSLFGDEAHYWIVHVGQVLSGSDMMWGAAYPVTMPIVAYPLVSPITAEDRVRAVDEATSEAVELADQADLPAQPVGAVGDPATAILQVAEAKRIDVIVVGSHERSWLDRLFHGSVAADVVRKAAVPVLVVK